MKYRYIEGFKFRYRISDRGTVEKEIAPGEWKPLIPYVHRSSAWVKLRRENAPSKSCRIMSLMRDYFMGGPRQGMRVARKSVSILDCSLKNLHWVPVGKIADRAHREHKKAVSKIDREGNVLATYPSVTEAAKKNYLSLMCIVRRCQSKIQNPYELIGYTFRYER